MRMLALLLLSACGPQPKPVPAASAAWETSCNQDRLLWQQLDEDKVGAECQDNGKRVSYANVCGVSKVIRNTYTGQVITKRECNWLRQ